MTVKTLASADSSRFAALKSVSSADRPNLIFTVFDREARMAEPHADSPFDEIQVCPTWRIRVCRKNFQFAVGRFIGTAIRVPYNRNAKKTIWNQTDEAKQKDLGAGLRLCPATAGLFGQPH
jgi:hypothetical protein